MQMGIDIEGIFIKTSLMVWGNFTSKTAVSMMESLKKVQNTGWQSGQQLKGIFVTKFGKTIKNKEI